MPYIVLCTCLSCRQLTATADIVNGVTPNVGRSSVFTLEDLNAIHCDTNIPLHSSNTSVDGPETKKRKIEGDDATSSSSQLVPCNKVIE